MDVPNLGKVTYKNKVCLPYLILALYQNHLSHLDPLLIILILLLVYSVNYRINSERNPNEIPFNSE